MKKILLALLCLFLMSCSVTGQLVINPSNDGNAMVNEFLGGNIPVFNVDYIGQDGQSGFFSSGTSSNVGLGFDSGIILTSGLANSAIGPNSSDGITTAWGSAGDLDLDALLSNSTFDAAVLEFDFELSGSGEIVFDFIFASDEYLEFVNGGVNDGFALFLDGVNIALIPGTLTPVSIDTVNIYLNSQFYVDNPFAIPVFDLEYDGFTVPIQANSGLLSAGSHHLKIVVADAGDDILDSAVLLRSSSFATNDECSFESNNILCDLDAMGQPTGDYVITGTFTNMQDIPGTHLFMPLNAISPQGVQVCFGNGQQGMQLVPPLNNGDIYEVGSDLSNSNAIVVKNAMPGDEVCFTMTLIGDNGVECCTLEACFIMPPCDCLQVDRRFDEISQVVCNPDGTVDFSYSFQLTNLFGMDVYHCFLGSLGNELFVPDYFDLTVSPLAQGQSVQLTTVIQGAQPSDLVDFLLTIHNEDLSDCCTRPHDVVAPICETDVLKGDVNCDGMVDLLDVAPFVDVISGGGPYNEKADVNCDGVNDLLDVQPFVALLSG